jgi:hypothetical protein
MVLAMREIHREKHTMTDVFRRVRAVATTLQ